MCSFSSYKNVLIDEDVVTYGVFHSSIQSYDYNQARSESFSAGGGTKHIQWQPYSNGPFPALDSKNEGGGTFIENGKETF